jgi:hypothetical protein
MSDVAIFALGSVVFVITSWATLAYGLATVHQMKMQDLENSPAVSVKPQSQFTDVYVRNAVADTPPASRKDA